MNCAYVSLCVGVVVHIFVDLIEEKQSFVLIFVAEVVHQGHYLANIQLTQRKWRPGISSSIIFG